MTLNSVLLPQPDGPTRLTKRPVSIDEVERRDRAERPARRRERHADLIEVHFHGHRQPPRTGCEG